MFAQNVRPKYSPKMFAQNIRPKYSPKIFAQIFTPNIHPTQKNEIPPKKKQTIK